jgi:hypothetical protein
MVLASLIGGFALAAIAQLVSAFPAADRSAGREQASRAVLRFALAAMVMMVNVWTGIVFFLDDGADRPAIAAVFYAGLFAGVALAGLGTAEMVAVQEPRLRRPILAMFAGLLVAEAALALAFLR